ncbi:MAG: hypothetical protein LBK42_12885 [Propionibacteriaceae bacterium]|nr:hypothetical protein [Propionibacteriaceae bacterium]
METDKLIELATKAVMDKLGAAPPTDGPQVTVFGDLPDGLLAPSCRQVAGRSPSDVEGSDYIVMTMAAFRAFHGGAIPAGLAGTPLPAPAAPPSAGRVIDLTAKRLVHERDLKQANPGDTVRLSRRAIVTALARDLARSNGLELVED